jgi:hypothetical protein
MPLIRIYHDRTEEILDDMAGMVAAWERHGESLLCTAARVALHKAAVIAYRNETEDMTSVAAAKWLEERCERMVEKWRRVAA